MGMVNDEQSDKLSQKQQVTVILRMLLDEQGMLVHGDLVDVDGQSRGRFSSWDDLVIMLREWSANHERKNS